MGKIFRFLLIVAILAVGGWFVYKNYSMEHPAVESKHQLLVDRIEAMGKLELVKYRYSDVVEHKNINAFLPDASVLLIVKADAVGCVNLTKLTPEDIKVVGDSVSIQLPGPEICYIKIDHDASKVYDTKMAFLREAQLVDEAYKAAEKAVADDVKKSDILQQTKANAITVFKPLLQGLGFTKINLTFK
ncbi:DUF4230 domain-containing protein [Sphingobacterium sp. N143]|uniref:DUF4230 domain-containing protein n=1 Tax=Sphingobacterium sp. N143 TaxID=2746727 RepID=UPI002574B6CB|nr:DUF4230 domain-containing protein [Sphingobacterium sp. N143]MDM1295678.1 DUF4230 domain-containing protein [Sphingobacterium sp. N143]